MWTTRLPVYSRPKVDRSMLSQPISVRVVNVNVLLLITSADRSGSGFGSHGAIMGSVDTLAPWVVWGTLCINIDTNFSAVL